jgi:hypothetical protein
VKPSTTFVTTATGIVTAGTLATWPFLAEAARGAVLGAGVLVLGTQIGSHYLLRRWRNRNDRFIVAIGAGFVGRVAVLALAIVLFVVPGRVPPAPFLVALGGFLVAVLFAESYIEHRRIRGAAALVKR